MGAISGWFYFLVLISLSLHELVITPASILSLAGAAAVDRKMNAVLSCAINYSRVGLDAMGLSFSASFVHYFYFLKRTQKHTFLPASASRSHSNRAKLERKAVS